MSKVVVYYIDDQANDQNEARRREVERYRDRLSRGDLLDCKLFPPPSWNELSETIFNPIPDLFLIDYDLTYQQLDGSHSEYRGSTLAAEIRMRYPNCPVVLITRESVLEELTREKILEIIERLEVFDEMLLKKDLEEDIGLTQELLVSLVNGCKKLSSYEQFDWQNLVDALNAHEADTNRLREASPPLKDGKWITISASSWIRHEVLEYPGILYDSLNSSVRLGITEEAFLDGDVQEIFTTASYEGVFSEARKYRRWWRSKLFEVGAEFVAQQQLDGPLELTFAKAFEQKFSRNLAQAECVWDCKPVADWICYVLRKPVKLEHTLKYYPDSRPDIMDDARISFRAIWGTNKYERNLLDSTGLEMLEKIESLEDPCKKS